FTYYLGLILNCGLQPIADLIIYPTRAYDKNFFVTVIAIRFQGVYHLRLVVQIFDAAELLQTVTSSKRPLSLNQTPYRIAKAFVRPYTSGASAHHSARSEERRVGKECSACRGR